MLLEQELLHSLLSPPRFLLSHWLLKYLLSVFFLCLWSAVGSFTFVPCWPISLEADIVNLGPDQFSVELSYLSHNKKVFRVLDYRKKDSIQMPTLASDCGTFVYLFGSFLTNTCQFCLLVLLQFLLSNMCVIILQMKDISFQSQVSFLISTILIAFGQIQIIKN